MQYSVRVQNARLDAVESTIGAAATLRFRTGAVPASCAAADSGTVVATIALPADWMAAAANGSKSKSGTWEDTAADAAGVIGHFRIYSGDGACDMQGTVSLTGGGGEITVDNTNAQVGQDIIVTAFVLNSGNK